MRRLTLDEKISMKGLFARKGIVHIPTLTMKDVVYIWYVCFGFFPITRWYCMPLKNI